MVNLAQTRLCRLDEVAEGCSRGLTAKYGGLMHDVFIVCKDGEVYAYHNRCPHTGGPLDWVPDQFLSLDGQHIQCATHAALFRIHDGLCVAGPCGGQFLERLPVTVMDDEIHLDVADSC